MRSRRWNGALNGIGCRSLRSGWRICSCISGGSRSCGRCCSEGSQSSRKRTESLMMMMRLMMVMVRRSSWANAVATASVRMRMVTRTAGSYRRSSKSGRERMWHRRRSHSSSGSTPMMMMKWSSPWKRIGWSRNSTSSSCRNSRIKSVTGGSCEFSCGPLSRTIPQDAVDAWNTRRRPICAHTFQNEWQAFN